jgi:hypothetical protein
MYVLVQYVHLDAMSIFNCLFFDLVQVAETKIVTVAPGVTRGGHCVLKWILRGHFKPTPFATMVIMFEVISIYFGSLEEP